jgi:hypothetical protein
MRKLLIALLSVCLSVSAFAAPAGYTTIMATNVVDAGGNPLASGTATFSVVDASGHPMSVQLGGYGQVHTEAVSVPVVAGAFTAQVVDVSQTSPSFPCVSLNIVDNSTGVSVLSYNCIQPTGATYDLDMFSTSTTPVVQKAGDTFSGNLGVDGNLNVTGNLNLGGFNVGNLSATLLTAENANGILNAAQFPGADIGAKVNAAFASLTNGGTVHIPAGSYSFPTMMQIPDSVGGTTGFHIDCDAGAVLNWTGGTGNAIQLTNDIPGAAEVGIDGHGGCLLVSATTGAGNGINIPPSNTTYVTGMKIKKFANGIFIPGGNSVQIFNNTIQLNSCGICTTTVNPTGTNGYAPNALHIHDNEISSNGWGYHSIDSGVSATHGLGNVIRDNVFEANTIGDINADWDAHLQVTGNYFESAGVGVKVGATNNVFDIDIEGNYFTASAAYRSEIEIGFGWDFFISKNYEEGGASVSTGCKVNSVPGGSGGNNGIVAVNAFAQNAEGYPGGTTPTTHELCIQGTPVSTFGGTQRVESNLTVAGNSSIGGALAVAGTIFGATAQSNSSFPTTNAIMAEFGSLTIWAGPAAPGGTCTGGAAVFYYPTGWSMCISGNWVAK